MPAPARRPLRLLPGLAAALFLAHALLATPFVTDVAVAFRAQGFAQRRVEQAFVGTDMAAVQAGLTARIGAETPIALAPSIQDQPLYYQRFHEALYPRPIRDDAAHVLVPNRAGTTPERRHLGRLGRYDLMVTGPLRPDAATRAIEPRAPASTGRTIVLGTLSALAWIGLGWMLVRAFRSRFDGAEEPGEPASWATVAVVGLLACALAASLGTWLSVALPLPALAGLGLLAFGLSFRRSRPRLARLSAWSLVPGAVLAGLAARLIGAPIARWDGRSIWLFHARRLWEHGRFLVSEAQDPATLFSHPDYPLAWPAILAFPSSLETVFDERLAGLGAGFAMIALGLLAFELARSAVGAAPAAGLVAGLVVHVTRLTAGGYADGFLMLGLVVAFLALIAGRDALGGVALALAAITKVEGLPLAGLVWMAGTLASPRGRVRPALALAFLPALAQIAWNRVHGLDSLLKGGEVGTSLAAFASRFSEVLARAPTLLDAPGDTGVRDLIPAALAALVLAPMLLVRAARRREASAALALALLTALLAAAACAALPEPVEVFVSGALDRLLLHSGAFALMAVLLALSPDRAAGSAALAPRPAAAALPAPPAPAS